mmetsp:Transcript_15529/g.24139  ORF Transcript_15529/g.24139 Transcript_15529/m.24139 type:complete len:171 (-) Transcript_15529:97-609(-)|eukprot:CAMPEP_0196814266 /NCGR_PEP_ID=MMETSP1362-20130617/42230_1 /TAXON_ID=163516 /ORGANISM="Leptocylindrus danicus, Strain CCMP1856" /LENGTH=170 /DNA_ID=CAMNT_0042190823 /DNA_START=120 /DNA_END=632 /DNA_ORIENTATION=+
MMGNHRRSSSRKIRSSLLFKLGIPDKQAYRIAPVEQACAAAPSAMKNSSRLKRRSSTDNAVDEAKDGDNAKVAFNENVSVMMIPTRNDYSSRLRGYLWYDTSDLKKNVFRNAYEFAAEGNDWRRVVEEDDMYISGKTGELIHPVHIQRYYQERGRGALGSQPTLRIQIRD